MADKNFLTEIIDADLAEGKISEIHTRFPPEPNGYLHIGSAKAIYINWSIANQYGGKFNLRLDDTNPAREGEEYVNSIIEDLHWLGADPNGGIFYGSDYFDKCYEYAEKLIKEGKAYVDDLSADEIREYRGTLTRPGKESPCRHSCQMARRGQNKTAAPAAVFAEFSVVVLIRTHGIISKRKGTIHEPEGAVPVTGAL